MARDTAIGSNSVKNANVLSEAFRATRTGFLTAIVFSLFINILAFVGPLYMLQIYDRVITSRNLTTLAALTVIAAFLILVYATLEKIRSAVLIRLGILFSTLARSRLFDAVLKGSLLQPNGRPYAGVARSRYAPRVPHWNRADIVLRCTVGSDLRYWLFPITPLVRLHCDRRRRADLLLGRCQRIVDPERPEGCIPQFDHGELIRFSNIS